MASVCREALDGYFNSLGAQAPIELDFNWGTPTSPEFIYEPTRPQAEELRAEAKRLGVSLQDYCRQVLAEHIADAKAKERSYEDDLFAEAHCQVASSGAEPELWEHMSKRLTDLGESMESSLGFVGKKRPPGIGRSEFSEDNWKSYIDGVHQRQLAPSRRILRPALSQAEIDRRLDEMWA